MTAKMIASILILCCFWGAKASASTIDFYNYYLGVQVQGVSLDNDKVPGLDSSGWMAGVLYKGRLKDYFQFAVGVDYFYADDNLPFEQQVTDRLTDDVRTISSDVSGLSFYLEAGVQYKFPPQNRWAVGVLGGYRYSDISRGVLACSDCEEQQLPDFENAVYVKPFIEYQWSKFVISQLYYTQYVSGDPFDNGVGLQITVWAM